jgi:hypothetical protein
MAAKCGPKTCGPSALDITTGNFYSPFLLKKLIFGVCCGRARVAELADALDLGSSGQPWGFESPLSHHAFQRKVRFLFVKVLRVWHGWAAIDLTVFSSGSESAIGWLE